METGQWIEFDRSKKPKSGFYDVKDKHGNMSHGLLTGTGSWCFLEPLKGSKPVGYITHYKI